MAKEENPESTAYLVLEAQEVPTRAGALVALVARADLLPRSNPYRGRMVKKENSAKSFALS